MIHLLMSHPGTHAVAHAAPIAALPLLFRRAIAAVRRKPAAPEVSTSASGAGATGSDWDDLAEQQRIADALWHGKTEPRGYPVLGDKMLSQVRREYGTAELAAMREPGPPGGVPVRRVRFRRPDGEIVIDKHSRITVRPVNGQVRPDQPRRQPVYGEAPQLEVERDMARAAGERARQRYEPASPRLLDQVLAGLRRL